MKNDNKKDVTRSKRRDNRKTGRDGARKNGSMERANRENLIRQKLTSQVLAQEARENRDSQNQRELPEEVTAFFCGFFKP